MTLKRFYDNDKKYDQGSILLIEINWNGIRIMAWVGNDIYV